MISYCTIASASFISNDTTAIHELLSHETARPWRKCAIFLFDSVSYVLTACPDSSSDSESESACSQFPPISKLQEKAKEFWNTANLEEKRTHLSWCQKQATILLQQYSTLLTLQHSTCSNFKIYSKKILGSLARSNVFVQGIRSIQPTANSQPTPRCDIVTKQTFLGLKPARANKHDRWKEERRWHGLLVW